jgi:hypothetical protein
MWVEFVVQLWAIIGFAFVCLLIKDRLLKPIDIALLAIVSAEFVSATVALPLPALFVCTTSQSGIIPAIIWYALHYNSKHDIFWFRLCAGIVIGEAILFAVYKQYVAALAGLWLSFFFFRWSVKKQPAKEPAFKDIPVSELKF